MFCSKCGKKNLKNAKFCEGCGAALEADESQADDQTVSVELQKRKPIALWISIGIVITVAVVLVTVFIVVKGSRDSSYEEKMDLGRRYLLELKYEQAIVAFKEAIEIDPKRTDAYIELADLYVELGDYDRALDILKKSQEYITEIEDVELIAKKRKEIEEEVMKRERLSSMTGKPEELDRPQSTPAPTKALTDKQPDDKDMSTPAPTATPNVIKFSVSEIVGHTKEEAEKYLDENGFNIEWEEDYDSSVPEGYIVKTSPAADTYLTEGSTIEVVVSKGEDPTKIRRDMEVGETVSFGSYYMGKSEGIKPIEWIVLSKDDEKALLLSKKILDCIPYLDPFEDDYPEYTWEYSDLRSWLNNSFVKNAFDKDEIESVLEYTIKNSDNPMYGTNGGNDTTDKVFLLSLKEVMNIAYGFSDTYDKDESRVAEPTEYALKSGDWISEWTSFLGDVSDEYWEYSVEHNADCANCWWLRTPGSSSFFFMYVTADGRIEEMPGCEGKDYYDCRMGIRPAIYVKLPGQPKKEENIITTEKSVVEKYYPGLQKLADDELLSIGVDAKEYLTLGKWNKNDIVWQILEYSEDGNSALVISRDVICNRCYDDKEDLAFSLDWGITPEWAGCSLRAWLNDDFYKTAFTKKERQLIKKVELSNNSYEGKDYYNFDETTGEYTRIIVASESTKDKIFLLSPDDAYNKYFKNDLERAAFYIGSDEVAERWWLRWRGGPLVLSDVDIQSDEGDDDTSLLNNQNGVRPVMWVELTPEMIEENKLSCGNLEKAFYPQATKDDIYVVFGRCRPFYEYRFDYYEKPVQIKWKILEYDEENEKVLLFSEQLLGYMSYDENGSASWENSTIRKWINEDFCNESFSEKEKKLILEETVESDINAEYGTGNGNDTKDKLFLLSASEVEKYLKGNLRKNRLGYNKYGGLYGWWLRTAGSNDGNAAIMGTLGNLDLRGRMVDNNYGAAEGDNYDGVRLAMWISLK